jgi:hypothetical protein
VLYVLSIAVSRLLAIILHATARYYRRRRGRGQWHTGISFVTLCLVRCRETPFTWQVHLVGNVSEVQEKTFKPNIVRSLTHLHMVALLIVVRIGVARRKCALRHHHRLLHVFLRKSPYRI